MKTPKILIHRNPQFSKCPSCRQSAVLHHSRARNMTEQIIKKITFYKLYRCKECGWRGYLSTIILTSESFKAFIMYGALIILTGFLIRFILLKFLVPA